MLLFGILSNIITSRGRHKSFTTTQKKGGNLMEQNLDRQLLKEEQDSKQAVAGQKSFTEQEYVNISESSEFKTLSKRKLGFIVPMSILFFVIYFTLPLLSSFTGVLDGKAIGEVTWIWIYSLAIFIMVWTFTIIYVKKAASFDKDAEAINDKAKAGGYK